MSVKLKVLDGASAGKEFEIPTPRCLVGRGQDCHLQAKSEAVSRHHCLVYAKKGGIAVRDLKSRNGTFVNGQRVEEDCELHPGDRLQIGPLTFEICIEQAGAGKTRTLGETAGHTRDNTQSTRFSEEATVAGWLDEADEAARVRRLQDPDTRLLKPESTEEVKLQRALEERREADPHAETKATSLTKVAAANGKGDQHGRRVGKLPPRPEEPSEDSSEAAAHALKRFFERRW